MRTLIVFATWLAAASNAGAALLATIDYSGDGSNDIAFTAGGDGPVWRFYAKPCVVYTADPPTLAALPDRLTEKIASDAFAITQGGAGRPFAMDKIWANGYIVADSPAGWSGATVASFVPQLGKGFSGNSVTGITQAVINSLQHVEISGRPIPEPGSAILIGIAFVVATQMPRMGYCGAFQCS